MVGWLRTRGQGGVGAVTEAGPSYHVGRCPGRVTTVTNTTN